MKIICNGEEERPLAGMIRALLSEAIYYRKIGMSKRMAQRFLSKLGIHDLVDKPDI